MPYFDPDAMGAAIGEVMEGTEALLFGRRTWQVMAAAWPGRAGDPFADRMNEIPKYVASRTLADGDMRVEQHDLAASRRRHRRRSGSCGRAGDGGIQVMGSASLAQPARRPTTWSTSTG